MKLVKTGVTRIVLVGPRWAVKIPRCHGATRRLPGQLVRGWLANRSEWRHRHRPGVARPVLTIGHVAVVYPTVQPIPPMDEETWELLVTSRLGVDDPDRDEGKPSSWGLLHDRFVLIDYDRAWEQDDRGWVGGVYYWWQEHLARRWMKL